MSAKRPRKNSLRLEELEPRLAPATDLYAVPPADAGSGPVQVRFEWDYSSAAYKNEIGAFAVDDAAGRVNGLLPGDPGYVGAALARSQVVFASGSRAGAKNALTFNSGQLVGLYLVANGTTAQALAGQRNIYFTVDGVNADGVDHAQVNLRGDGGLQFRFEDGYGGGDRDYNDAVITLAKTHTIATPGQAGQIVQANFQKVSRSAAYANEVGLVQADSSDGTVGGVKPGDPGYVQALLSSGSRQVIFSESTDRILDHRTLNLSGGSFYVFYFVANGTADQALKSNPTNAATGRPLVYTSFASANPDGQEHVSWLSSNEIGFEDMPNLGDADFNDMVIRYGFSAPQGAATPGNTPPTITTVSDQSIFTGGSTLPQAFTVGDAETAPANLTVTATSSNQALIPNANISLGGSGADRTVMATAVSGQTGTATITLTVSDGQASAGTTFNVTVNPGTPPSFTATNPPTAPFNQGTQQQTVANFATFVPGSNGGTTPTYVVSNVSNPALFSTQPSVASNGTLSYTPVAGGFGSSTFTVTVNDGKTASAPQTFTINVDPVQGAPNSLPFSLSDPSWQTIPAGVRIEDTVVGNGATVQNGDTVNVDYKGYVVNDAGTNFQNGNVNAGPLPSGVIAGFAAGLLGMKVGGTRRIDIPSFLAYGNSPPPNSGIPANARLVFEVHANSIQ